MGEEEEEEDTVHIGVAVPEQASCDHASQLVSQITPHSTVTWACPCLGQPAFTEDRGQWAIWHSGGRLNVSSVYRRCSHMLISRVAYVVRCASTTSCMASRFTRSRAGATRLQTIVYTTTTRDAVVTLRYRLRAVHRHSKASGAHRGDGHRSLRTG